MKKNIIIIKDNEDCNYIYGAILLKRDNFNFDLLQERLDNMRKVLDKAEENGELNNIDYNGEYVVKRVLESYKEYKDLEYIEYTFTSLYV